MIDHIESCPTDCATLSGSGKSALRVPTISMSMSFHCPGAAEKDSGPAQLGHAPEPSAAHGEPGAASPAPGTSGHHEPFPPMRRCASTMYGMACQPTCTSIFVRQLFATPSGPAAHFHGWLPRAGSQLHTMLYTMGTCSFAIAVA